MKYTSADIAQFLQDGEGYRIEFKERITNLDKEIVAFANASGGRIFIGISDTGKIKGITIDNIIKSQIQDIANNCDPPVKLYFDQFERILIVEVKEGPDKPYKCTSGFYTRVGPNSQKLSRDEIVEFVKNEGRVRFDEMLPKNFPENDFSTEKFNRFLDEANISAILPYTQILRNLGACEWDRGRPVYNNTSVLFFAKDLSAHYRHTTITCALYKGVDKVTVLDRKDFNEDIMSDINNAMMFLKQHLKLRYEFDGSLARKEIPELPYEALREAVINAVVHRDYFQKGANVMVELFDDRLEIVSPGALPKGLSPSDFGHKSMRRNPNIADLLQRAQWIEKMGTGIKRMQDMMEEAGLSPIDFSFTSFVSLTFWRYPRPEIKRTSKTTPEGKMTLQLLELLRTNPALTRAELAQLLGSISEEGVKYHLAKLKRQGKIKRQGSDVKGVWIIND